MIKLMQLQYPVPFLRRVLSVSASGYYAWIKRGFSIRAREEARLEVGILAAHKRTRGTCGSNRLKENLLAHGVKVGVSRIMRIRKKLGKDVRRRIDSG